MKRNITIVVLTLVIAGLFWFKGFNKCEDLSKYLQQLDQAQKAVNELQKLVNGN